MLVLLAAACAGQVFAGQSNPLKPSGSASNDTITIVTLNLWHDKADWPSRQGVIATGLQVLRPDVIVLQEVLQHEALENQAASLAILLGYRYQFVSVDPPSAPRRYGNAILTRHSFLAQGSRALQPLDDYRSAGHARLLIGDAADGPSINVYATHLHHVERGASIRARQVADLIAFIDETAHGLPSIIAGDFNAAADAPELDAITQRYSDAYGVMHPDSASPSPEHSTLNLAYFSPRRIDHVFFDPDAFEVVAAHRLFTGNADEDGERSAWASDHYGVAVTLRPR